MGTHIFNSDLCSLFSFTYYWNFSWVFTEALTEIFKLAIHTLPQEKPGEIATLQSPCVVFSRKVLPSLCRGVAPCPELPSWHQDAAEHLGAHSPQAMPKSWTMRNKSNLPAWGPSFSSSTLRCYHSEPGSCTARGTEEMQPPCSSGFQGLKMTQFLDLMQVNNSLSARPASLRWIDFFPELVGCFLTLKSSKNRKWMWCWTVLCLRRALNITSEPLGDGRTNPSHLCETEILTELLSNPEFYAIYDGFMFSTHLQKDPDLGPNRKSDL